MKWSRALQATRKWCKWTMAIFGYAGHCACVGSTSWALLCKCTRLCWATHGWPRNKGNVEPCWAKSLTSFKFDSTRLKTAQELSTGCSNALNLLRACTVDKSSAFARGLKLFLYLQGQRRRRMKKKLLLWIQEHFFRYLIDKAWTSNAKNFKKSSFITPWSG